jgi:hypothetical protein
MLHYSVVTPQPGTLFTPAVSFSMIPNGYPVLVPHTPPLLPGSVHSSGSSPPTLHPRLHRRLDLRSDGLVLVARPKGTPSLLAVSLRSWSRRDCRGIGGRQCHRTSVGQCCIPTTKLRFHWSYLRRGRTGRRRAHPRTRRSSRASPAPFVFS